jgi:hypothetical protein
MEGRRARIARGVLALVPVALVCAWAALSAPFASAATEVIGELGRPGVDCAEVGKGNIYAQAYFVSTAGTIIEWSIQTGEAVPSPTAKLKVLDNEAGLFTVVGDAAMGPLAPEAITTFDVDIPVLPGDRLALYTGNAPSPGKCFQVDSYAAGAELLGDVPVGGRKGSNGIKTGYRAPISAVVLPPPVVTGLAPIAGPSTGGTPVTISGENLRRVESVSFGTITTTAFTEVSETKLTVLSPPEPVGPVDVRVSTVAGESPASAADHFTYAAPPSTALPGKAVGGAGAGPSGASPATAPAQCKVPKLRGRNLKAAKQAIRHAGCRVGKLTKVDGVSAATGKVKTQRPRAGRSVAKGTKVAVTLG